MFVPTAFFGGEPPAVYDNLFRGSWDASNAASYPGSGATWYNVSGSGNFTETNSTFVTWNNSGSADYFTYAGNAYHTIGDLSTPAFQMKDGVGGGNYGSGWTFSVWYYPGSMNGEGIMTLYSATGTNRFNMAMWTNNNRFNWYGTQFPGQTSVVYSANNWYNVIYSYDGVTFRGYVNNSLQMSGVKNVTVPVYDTSTSATVSLFLGRAYVLPSSNYYSNSSRIAMMEMWNRGIRSDEVTDIWNYHKARFGY